MKKRFENIFNKLEEADKKLNQKFNAIDDWFCRITSKLCRMYLNGCNR